MHLVLAVPTLQFSSLPKVLPALEPDFALGKFTSSPDLQSGLAQGCVKEVLKSTVLNQPTLRGDLAQLWFLPPPYPGAPPVTPWRGEIISCWC